MYSVYYGKFVNHGKIVFQLNNVITYNFVFIYKCDFRVASR